ncbi:MAG TPA: hypothetical protein VHW00_21410 [Thermoanaerobaculia bacterium]|nr:hypothetical protein [Thermoanaerobaculia bacterium]
MTREQLKFILQLTNYFDGHWEDPDWGTRPLNQVLALVGAHTFAEGIADVKTREAVQSPIATSIVDVAQRFARKQA